MYLWFLGSGGRLNDFRMFLDQTIVTCSHLSVFMSRFTSLCLFLLHICFGYF
uniref:Uncharacterized protein n=1 Tax=Octopus bimaculoides TaxID=37653 RepID=A0A0L8H4T7_OCTBM